MTRRIDIELTSDRGDGTWTWRSAGAKQPKGTLDASTLFDGATVGDVCRADADFAMDGIFIEAVLPPKGRSGRPAEEQILLTGDSFEGGVTTTWKDRKGRDGDRKGGRGDRKGGRGGERGRGKGRGPGDRGDRGHKREGSSRDGGRRGGGDNREGGDNKDKSGQRRDGADRGRGRRDDRKRDGRNQRGPRPDDRPRPKKLRPGRVHRSAWIETLAEEQKVVAETLSRGGIQAVRKEIDTQNEKAKADGSNPIDGSALIALAEELLPNLRRAEWRDRADAALGDMGEIDLKDLRSVVVASDDAAKDEESLEVAEKLRTGLKERVEAAQIEWVAEIASTLSDGRVVRALRLSSRPPKAGALMPGDLLQRLTETANEAVKGDVTQQRLATLLDAVSRSVVRPNFVLETAPEKPTDELLDTVKKVAAQLPDVAAKFGVSATRRPRRGARKSAPKRPPKPTAPAPAPVGETASEAAAPEATEQGGAKAEAAPDTGAPDAIKQSEAEVEAVAGGTTPEPESAEAPDQPKGGGDGAEPAKPEAPAQTEPEPTAIVAPEATLPEQGKPGTSAPAAAADPAPATPKVDEPTPAASGPDSPEESAVTPAPESADPAPATPKVDEPTPAASGPDSPQESAVAPASAPEPETADAPTPAPSGPTPEKDAQVASASTESEVSTAQAPSPAREAAGEEHSTPEDAAKEAKPEATATTEEPASDARTASEAAGTKPAAGPSDAPTTGTETESDDQGH